MEKRVAKPKKVSLDFKPSAIRTYSRAVAAAKDFPPLAISGGERGAATDTPKPKSSS